MRILGRENRQTDRKSPYKGLDRFPKILLRTNEREQTSCLKIGDENLLFPIPVSISGNGKIKKLSVMVRLEVTT